ncbi:HAD-IA family hydrolase, partial [Salmonella enterica subsp. enterica serovar Cerro]|nr:HAD-IA family hydrolase [Salmonella enterica subsp. enterica serovar Cerro]
PETRIYQHVLQKEGFSAADAVFFDDNADNIEGANQLGITSILGRIRAGGAGLPAYGDPARDRR